MTAEQALHIVMTAHSSPMGLRLLKVCYACAAVSDTGKALPDDVKVSAQVLANMPLMLVYRPDYSTGLKHQATSTVHTGTESGARWPVCEWCR